MTSLLVLALQVVATAPTGAVVAVLGRSVLQWRWSRLSGGGGGAGQRRMPIV